jgi:RecB family exonuclease
MLRNYPDSSDLTFVVSTERGRCFVQNYAHREVGGLLPSFKSYDEYKAEILSDRLGLKKMERPEELIYLTLFLREFSPKHGEDSGFAAFNMLPAIRYACMFSLGREEMKNLKGIRPEQVEKIDELFDVMDAFDEFLETRGLFMSALRERHFLDHTPGEKDFFINLPLFTPATESFFSKIPLERKLVDMPTYADAFKESKPDYASSLHLLARAGIPMSISSNASLTFHELQGKASLPAHLSKGIADFLKEDEEHGQIFILLLDEGLSFYLWQTVFRHLGSLANFSVGLPLTVTSAGSRLYQFIEGIDQKRNDQDFSNFKMGLARELYRHRNDYVREELCAIEAAIDFVDSLEKYHEPLGGAFSQVASLLLQQKQFFLKGDRTAPVQIVGLGEATGAPFEYGIVLPLNGDIFPSKIYNGPFLNFVHTPQVRDAHLEMEDLALRQFMSLGKNIDIVSVFDEAKDMTPSFFFTFLKNEFGGSITKCSLPMPPVRSRETVPFVENGSTVRGKILEHSFSFSSLSRLLTCPFSFYYADIERLSIPDVMQDEENINLILGSFVHKFFNRLAEEAKPLGLWKAVFDELWARSADIAQLEGNGLFRLLLLSQLEALTEHEVEDERLLLFGQWKRSNEKSLEAGFGDSSKFKLNGRLDALVERNGARTILDYKYKNRPSIGRKSLAEALAKVNSFDPRFQIALYAYLLAEAESIPLETISGYFVYIKEDDPKKRFDQLEASEIQQVRTTMRALSERIEQILSLERLEPNYKSVNCKFCLLKSLCKAENFYRKSARKAL